jgi:hypothetical protein
MTPTTTRVVELPPNTWHSYVSRKSGTLALEVKQGAYIAAAEADFLPGSPAENSDEAIAYSEWMKSAGPGDDAYRYG